MTNSTKIKRFTAEGLDAYRDAVVAFLADPTMPSPSLVSSVEELTSPAGQNSLEKRSFEDRFEFAKYLYEQVSSGDGEVFRAEATQMDWIASFYFDELTSSKSGPKLGEIARYVLSDGYRNAHRHLVAGPLETYSVNGDASRLLLAGSALHTPGDTYEQVASRREIRTNPSVMGAAYQLYFDEAGPTRKRGINSTKARGSIRRFIQLIQQLDLTFDVYGLDQGSILSLLPAEFDRWKS